jgi:cystathionine gamma-lyase
MGVNGMNLHQNIENGWCGGDAKSSRLYPPLSLTKRYLRSGRLRLPAFPGSTSVCRYAAWEEGLQDDFEMRAAALLHRRRRHLAKGDPVPLPIMPAAMFHLPGDPAGHAQYGRSHNPTWEGVEDALSHLEDADCVAFPSGMAAIAAALFATVKAGDRVLLPSDGYYTTRVLAERFLKPLGVDFDLRPTATYVDGGFDNYRLVYLETPANPGLDICDISAVARGAHAAGALVVADNTTMTPFGQRPLDRGADLVVAADTKAPNGHSDALLGHVATRDRALLDRVREWRKLSGSIPGPFEAWQVHRGLETLELRFERMCATAGMLAERLRGHRTLTALRYPGLPDDPAHNLARMQMRRFGFLIGLTLESEAAAERFIDGCSLIQPATSFGGVHTSAERRARWGDAVAPGFVRLSIGIEPAEELWSAVSKALDDANN